MNKPSLSKLLLTSTIIFSLVFSTSCGGGGGGGDSDDESGDSSTAVGFSATSDSAGRARVTVPIPTDTTKFSVIAQASGQAVVFTEASDSDSNDYLSPGGELISTATEIFPNINSLNLPSRSNDPSLDSARSYTFEVGVGSSSDLRTIDPRSDVDVSFTIQTSTDGDFGSGALTVNIFRVGSIAQTADVISALESAKDLFRRIYSDIGISVSFNDINISGPDVLPDPGLGSNFYLDAVISEPSPSVNIFIGGDIEGIVALGLAAGIPGPSLPTSRSAIAVSVINSSGVDGNFNGAEIDLLGETLAHESGHFLGLFHPVDFSGNTVIATDPLADTQTCAVRRDCESRSSLNMNLMFANPVIGSDGNLIPQRNLTGDQREVMHRNSSVG